MILNHSINTNVLEKQDSSTVKGMTNMSISTEVYQLVECFVFHYATFDSDDFTYSLHVHDVPDFDIRELVSLILSQDKHLTLEATGPDNPLWETKMFPALLQYLSHSTDRDKEIEFNKEWQEGITSYFLPHIQNIFDEVCIKKSSDRLQDNNVYRKPNYTDLYQGRL
jgi:hypothetical protein